MPTDWQHNPPRDASMMPFWFWNDAIDADAVRRSIADFDAHGVYGFVIHPRVGLPRSIGWMSDAMLDLMHVAIEEAARRDMKVILYDEGMYPSGSSSGQVVARDGSLAARCLALHDASKPLPRGTNRIASFEQAGTRYDVIDRVADSYIRGLHYLGDGPAEDEPPAADICNPRTTQAVIELVYERYAERFREHFGKTILGIFTDEPNAMGKSRDRNVWPSTAGIVGQLRLAFGDDFASRLPALWFDDVPDATETRHAYHAAVRAWMRESWYANLSEWCRAQGLWLMGHPDSGDDFGTQRFFHAPGQDLVWRFVEPGKPSAIEGHESTQAKCTASAKVRFERTRNSNELCGAYGHQTTFDEFRWLCRWCIIRGVDLLIPHAFYHSVRGPRRDERPPQLGPHTPTWNDGSFQRLAAECQRLCALNMIGTPVCDIAILTHGDRCLWPAAKVCFEHQRDFHYVTSEQWSDIQRAPDETASRYRALIEDRSDTPTDVRSDRSAETTLERPAIESDRTAVGVNGPKLIRFDGDESALLAALDRLAPRDVMVYPPNRDLRVRHLRVESDDVYLFFNEGGETIDGTLALSAVGDATWIDPETGSETPAGAAPVELSLKSWRIAVLRVRSNR